MRLSPHGLVTYGRTAHGRVSAGEIPVRRHENRASSRSPRRVRLLSAAGPPPHHEIAAAAAVHCGIAAPASLLKVLGMQAFVRSDCTAPASSSCCAARARRQDLFALAQAGVSLRGGNLWVKQDVENVCVSV